METELEVRIAQGPVDRRAAVFELAEPVNDYGPERPAKLLAQQERAFQKVWNQTPAELDKAFGAWVLKTYRK